MISPTYVGSVNVDKRMDCVTNGRGAAHSPHNYTYLFSWFTANCAIHNSDTNW